MRAQSFEEHLLQFMGDNKKLLNLHEQKFAEFEATATNSNFSEHHQCIPEESGDISRAASLNPAKPEERCLPK